MLVVINVLTVIKMVFQSYGSGLSSHWMLPYYHQEYYVGAIASIIPLSYR